MALRSFLCLISGPTRGRLRLALVDISRRTTSRKPMVRLKICMCPYLFPLYKNTLLTLHSYRLFGRRVLRNRQCSVMNGVWRSILRSRALASVTLHRKPAPRTVDLASLIPVPLVQPTVGTLGLLGLPIGPPTGRVTLETKPFIHVLFRPEFAEPWMTQLVSDIPKTPVDWLVARGFGDMEHFDVKVGVAPAGLDRRS
jgi:hypothetical protein